MPYDSMRYYQILTDSLFQGNVSEFQSSILLDIIRNTDMVNLERLSYDINTTIDMRLQQTTTRMPPRTRGAFVQPTQPTTQQPATPNPRYTKPTYKEKVVAITKKQATTQEECPICQESHPRLNTLMADTCKHTFGTQCISHWMDICWTRDKKRATCPTCRVDIYSVTKYKERAAPKNKPKKTKKTPLQNQVIDLSQDNDDEETTSRIEMPHHKRQGQDHNKNQGNPQIQFPQLWTPPSISTVTRIAMPHHHNNL